MFDAHAYENVGDFVKALGHEKRLQLIDLLSAHERCVEDLAALMDINIKSVSAHLRVMRTQGLVTTRKEGLRVYYRLCNNEVLTLFQHIWQVALYSKDITPLYRDSTFCLTLKDLLTVLDSEHTLLIDVRDADIYREGHIPGATSVPLENLMEWAGSCTEQQNLIVVYCEGCYCIQAIDATEMLRDKGYNVKMYRNGLDEWANSGFDLEK